jgi:tetratricopeptide (TPR) repeat protein
MNLDSHPEEMLGRAIAGELQGAEHSVLDEHLAVCRVCAAHLVLARTRQEAAQPWDNQLNRQAVERALAAFERGRWSVLLSTLTQRRWLLLTAGMLIALASAASAAWWHKQYPAQEPAGVAGGARSRAVPIALAPAPSKRALAAPEAQLLQPSAPMAEERSPSPQPSRVLPSAASLFEQGSALREQNNLDDAIVVFRKLQRLYPRARESRMSFALVGRMLLARGRPTLALSQFDQHLAQNGEASEEALAGRAAALGQMGRFSAESETWQRLLDAYPGSVYASQARNRLSRLQTTPKGPAGIEHSR